MSAINWLDVKVGQVVDYLKRSTPDAPGSGQIVLAETAKWYCAVVRPNAHRAAELDLAQMGFRSFYPKSRRWISHARVKRAKERPILGRYLFVEVDHPRQSFNSVSSLFDIESMVSNLGNPTPFPSHWVEKMLCRYIAGEWDEVTHGKLPVGARIKIIEGEFAEQYATVTSSKGHRVDLKLLGSNQYTKMNQCSVRAA